jgi:hypothetical protein
MEAALVAIMFLGPGYTLYKRLNQKKTDGNPMGLGQRVIQLVALFILVPAILVLALESVLPKDALVSLLGTIVGYSLSGLTKDL